MPLSLAALMTPLTRDEVVSRALSVLSSAGFPTSSWGSTSVPRVLIEAFAQIAVDLSGTIAGLASMVTLETAEGEGLTTHAADAFDVARNTALPTKGTRVLVESAGTPQSWGAGELVIVCSADASLTYRNVSAVTLPAYGSVSVTFAAEVPGSAYNVDGATVGELATPIPGVAITPSSGLTWITQTGVDEETDDALRARCRLKWATLSTTGPAAAYESWALASSSEITKVRVLEDPTAVYPTPEVRVLCASPTGAPTGGALAAAAAYVEARRPLGTWVVVQAADVYIAGLYGTVYIRSAYRTAAEAQVQRDLQAHFAALPIGGRLVISELIEIVMAVQGVTNVVFKNVFGTPLVPGTDDVSMAEDATLSLSLALTYTSV